MTEQSRVVFERSPDVTEGPLLRGLLVLAGPLLVQNLVRVVQQVVDLFWLGRLGGDAVAGVSLAFPVLTLLFALAVFAPFVGTQVLVSQRVGSDDDPGARRALAAGLLVALVLGVGVGLVAALLSGSLVRLLTATRPGGGAVVGMATAYLQVSALGLAAVTLGDTVEAAFVGHGDSRASLWMNVVAVGVNVLLDPVLIFGLGPVPAWGVAGAALASVLGAVAGLAIGGALVARGRNGGMLAVVRPPLADLRELLDVGVPVAGQQLARQSVRVVIVVVVFAASGAAGLAAYLLGARVASVAFVPAIGLQQAAQSVVGQNVGSGSPDRAARATWLGVAVAAGGLGVVGVLQWFVPGPVIAVLAPGLGTEATDLSVTYLQILAYGYPAIGAAYLLEAGFNGASRTRTSFLATLGQFWAVRLPLAAGGVFLLGYGVEAVFWAVTASNVVVALGLALYYRHEVENGMLSRASEAVG